MKTLVLVKSIDSLDMISLFVEKVRELLFLKIFINNDNVK